MPKRASNLGGLGHEEMMVLKSFADATTIRTSAMGHKRKWWHVSDTSALPQEADIVQPGRRL